MGERRAAGRRWAWPAPFVFWLIGGVVVLVLLLRMIFEATGADTVEPDELRATVDDLLAVASAEDRSGVTVDQRSCAEGDSSPGLYSSATEVWTVPRDGRAAAVERLTAHAPQLGFELQSGSFGQDGRPLRTFARNAEPAYVEVRARESASGDWELVVAVYDTCSRH